MHFHNFDEAYLGRLQNADPRTEQHFVSYFSALIQIKLRHKLPSREAIEDARQETFARFFMALRRGKILQPDRLGSFVNSICNNVLKEHYRGVEPAASLDEDDDNEKEIPAQESSALESLESRESAQQVREILDKLKERDRRILKEIFLEERDKDAVCRDFSVDRDYLRVLVLRAKNDFKEHYLKKFDRRKSQGM